MARLEAREKVTDIPATRQIVRALLAATQEVEAGNSLPAPSQFLEAERRVSLEIPKEDWGRVAAAAKTLRYQIRDFAQIAIARMLESDEQQGKASADKVPRAIEDKFAALGVTKGLGQKPITPNDPLREAQPIQIVVNVPMESVILRRLESVPCGPWKEVLEETQPYALPKDLAEVLGAQAGDLLVPCEGESMLEAGVPNKGRVIMRPLNGIKPKPGEIVLCCVERENGQWESTIKFWYNGPNALPELRNGKLELYKFPDDTVEVYPVATLVAVMGRATAGTVKGRQKPKD